MAIQISEKHLSPEAVKALNNAKNKSQFMRDAIEFYVRRGQNPEIQEELKEIKQMIANLQSTVESLRSSQNATSTGYIRPTSISQKSTKQQPPVRIPECYE